jgi:hypothetical protein
MNLIDTFGPWWLLAVTAVTGVALIVAINHHTGLSDDQTAADIDHLLGPR